MVDPRLRSACFAIGDSSLGGGDDAFAAFNRIGVHASGPSQKRSSALGVLQLHVAANIGSDGARRFGSIDE
jgi:hypothetical protein